MISKLADLFVCLRCKDVSLSLTDAALIDQERVQDGNLRCDCCGSQYPIINGIPRFVSSEDYSGSFGLQWNIHRKTQLDSYTAKPISEERVRHVTGWTLDGGLGNQFILEAGSGAGRFTEILVKTGATLFSFDLSKAVEANFKNNGRYSNLCVFQGNLLEIPFPDGFFNKVICLGVLQHTPSPEEAFKSLFRCVKPGGEIVIDIYAKRLTALFAWKYLLRPITKHISPKYLYNLVRICVPALIPISRWLKKIFGKIGARLVPIIEYSELGLQGEINRDWAILDTFDMYSPMYDQPQTVKTLTKWFKDAGCKDFWVGNGPNGLVGRGVRRSEDSGMLGNLGKTAVYANIS